MPHPVPFFNPAAVLGREDQAEKPLLALNTLRLKIATFVSKQLWLFAIYPDAFALNVREMVLQ
jgi:hypothetical protein